MKNTDATTLSAPGRQSKRWPLFIVGLLAGHVLLMVVACTMATRDKTFSVVPDYYSRELHWDQAKAARAASEKLGWRIEVEAGTKIDSQGRRTVSFVLTDAAGRPVEGASLEAVFFHDAHAAQRQHVTVGPDGGDPRRFTMKLPMPYEGDWEFQFTAKANDKTFVASTVQYLKNEQP